MTLARPDATPASFLTVQYAPAEGAVSAENPPRLSWLPDVDASASYVLWIEPVGHDAMAYSATGLSHNFHTPPVALTAGRWRWQYAVWDAAARQPASDSSVARTFTIAADAQLCPGLNARPAIAAIDVAHPRLWLREPEVKALNRAVKADATYLTWDRFMQSSVAPFVARDLIAEPAPYPNNKREIPLWRQMYMDCQELLYAVRHLAVAGRVLQDDALRQRAKQWLTHIAAFDVRGTTSRQYNDEAAFRVALALAWGYDWLHDTLTDAERARVKAALVARMEEVVTHVTEHARVNAFPLDSHAVRAIGMVIIPGSIALLGEHEAAADWLEFSIRFYDTLYSPWGGADGGWAEGAHYWTTALAYFNESAQLVKKLTGHDFMRRAFFQKTGFFPLYTKSPDALRGSFCDDPTLGEPLTLKIGYLMRDCAAATAGSVESGWFQWYFERILDTAAGTEELYYNYGWWSLPFDNLCFLHDNAAPAPKPPADLPALRHFDHVGWVALQRHMDEPTRHAQVVAKCSPYGSVSHSHGDQGAFTFFAYGEDLAIQSGYYVGHNSTMHRNWRRQTLSKNALLFDRRGQYAGDNKAQQIAAKGHIQSATTRDDGVIHVCMDATLAYAHTVPELTHWLRDLYWLPGDQLVVVDRVVASAPVAVTWLLHTQERAAMAERSFRVTGKRAELTAEVVFSSEKQVTLTQVEGFDGVDEKEYAGQRTSHRVELSTAPITRLSLAVLLTPQRIGHSNRLMYFLDDQGFATHLYFCDSAGKSYTVTLPKAW